jgi:hypothetical protein
MVTAGRSSYARVTELFCHHNNILRQDVSECGSACYLSTGRPHGGSSLLNPKAWIITTAVHADRLRHDPDLINSIIDGPYSTPPWN